MKKTITGILIGFCVTLLISFQISTKEINNSSAEVNMVDGLLIFTDCKPLKEYDNLGTVPLKKVTWNGGQCYCDMKYDDARSELLTQIKKKYPQAEGVIFNGVNKADAIKFK